MATGYQIAEKARIPLADKWGYIWGKSGQLWTRDAWNQLKKDRVGNSNYTNSIKYGEKWIGHRVADCSGLIVWIYNQFGLRIAHGSNSMWSGYLMEKGTISGEIPVGALVFKVRNKTDYYHVGVYVGNGKVIESRGAQSGVVESSLGTWTHYGLSKGISYTSDKKEESPMEKGTAVVDVPNDGTLWVRTKPSGEKKDAIREGDEVTVLEVDGDWAKVKYEAEGWVMSRFLRG